MNLLRETTFKQNNIHFHLVPTEQFKTITFVIKLKAPLERHTVTKRALLSYMFKQGTNSYPTASKLEHQLAHLYGATLKTFCFKRGEEHIIDLRLEVANEKFVPDHAETLEEALQLLREILFNPLTQKDSFKRSVVEREKETLRNKQASLIDEKSKYANIRLMETMCEQERYRLRTYGYTDDLDSIDAKSLYDYYKTMLQQDRIDIYVVGYVDIDRLRHLLPQMFSRKLIPVEQIEEDRAPKRESVQQLVEQEPIQQAKLHLGYRTNITYKDREYAALQIFNGLFGGYPSSKLFMTVRETYSLAYYIQSQLESFKGLLIVHCGIDGKEKDRVIDLIAEQFTALKEGEFSDDDLEEIKRLTVSSLYETCDHATGIVELLYQKVLGNYDRPLETYVKELKAVDQEDIIQAAQSITLDTTYVLLNEGDENNEQKDI